MRLSAKNDAIEAIRKNPRMCESLREHVAGVRQHEMEMLATAADDIGNVRFMQGRIAVLSDLMKLLDQ